MPFQAGCRCPPTCAGSSNPKHRTTPGARHRTSKSERGVCASGGRKLCWGMQRIAPARRRYLRKRIAPVLQNADLTLEMKGDAALTSAPPSFGCLRGLEFRVGDPLPRDDEFVVPGVGDRGYLACALICLIWQEPNLAVLCDADVRVEQVVARAAAVRNARLCRIAGRLPDLLEADHQHGGLTLIGGINFDYAVVLVDA